MAGLDAAGLRLGVLGGTFDPVHIGHLILAEAAREELALDRLLFVPAGQPWRKAGRDIATAADRLAMLEFAVSDNPAFEVCTIEVEREGPSYTVETLSEIKARSLPAQIFFIVGEDALEDMPNWKEPERIAELAEIVAAPRPGRPSPHETGRITLLRGMPIIGVSATAVRERVRDGRPIRYLVPPAVEDYIRRRQLYISS